MSSTRLPYDDSVYNSYIKQSTSSNQYLLNKNFREDIRCFPDVPGGHPTNFVSYNEEQANIENDLSNRDTKKQKYYQNLEKFEN